MVNQQCRGRTSLLSWHALSNGNHLSELNVSGHFWNVPRRQSECYHLEDKVFPSEFWVESKKLNPMIIFVFQINFKNVVKGGCVQHHISKKWARWPTVFISLLNSSIKIPAIYIYKIYQKEKTTENVFKIM